MARRGSLIEFQENLSKRLATARAQASVTSLLAVQSGGVAWLLPLPDAGEVMPVPPLATVPLTHPWYAGVANVRGNLYSVIDFAAFCGKGNTPRHPTNRLMLCGQRHGLNAGLLIQRVLGLRDPGELKSAAGEAAAQKPWIDAVLEDAAGQRYQQLNVPALVASTEFMSVNA
jgi:twitching motility protein PilI